MTDASQWRKSVPPSAVGRQNRIGRKHARYLGLLLADCIIKMAPKGHRSGETKFKVPFSGDGV